LADPNNETQAGIHLNSGGTELSASEHVVDKVLQTAEHIWFGTIDRVIAHPILGIPLFGLLLVIVVLKYWSSKDRRKEEI
jgi:Fe2+ transport system protein B